MWVVLLQPSRFFRALPTITDTRQWVWMALIILLLTGISAARADAVAQESGDAVSAPPMDMGGGEMPGDPFSGGLPADFGMPGAATDTTAGQSNTEASWTTALLASSNIVALWLIVSILLGQVSLVRGRAPRLAYNLQIAVWSSVPLGLMAGLQIIYYAAGGKVGEPGVAGLLPDWDWYLDLTRGQRSLVLSAAIRTTLFSLWGLTLVYLGARHTLRGPVWASLVAVLLTAIVVVAIPVAVGTIKAPDVTIESLPGDEMMPFGPGFEDEFMPGEEEQMPPGDELSEPADRPVPGGMKG